jgi:hypothetical protein
MYASKTALYGTTPRRAYILFSKGSTLLAKSVAEV